MVNDLGGSRSGEGQSAKAADIVVQEIRDKGQVFFTFDEKGPEPAMFPALFQTSFKNRVGGSIAQWLAYLLSDPAAPGSILSILRKNSKEKIDNIDQVHQWHYLEESRPWLENVDRTHLVMACDKLVLQKDACM